MFNSNTPVKNFYPRILQYFLLYLLLPPPPPTLLWLYEFYSITVRGFCSLHRLLCLVHWASLLWCQKSSPPYCSRLAFHGKNSLVAGNWGGLALGNKSLCSFLCFQCKKSFGMSVANALLKGLPARSSRVLFLNCCRESYVWEKMNDQEALSAVVGFAGFFFPVSVFPR